MMDPLQNRRGGVRWLLGFGLWTLLGLIFASQLYFSSALVGRPVSWSQAVTWSLGDWYVWAVLSLPIAQLSRQFRLERGRWRTHFGIHLAACVVVSFAYMVARAGLGQLQRWLEGTPVAFSEAFHPLVLKTFHSNLLVYWVVVAVNHAFNYYREAQERERRAVELEKRLVEAKLQALQMQLNPHFLFNTLHAISSLMHKDVDAADRMIARLSELLRYALESTDAQEVPLRQEIDFLKRYLEIEQTRFGDRLKVQIEIAPDTLSALVPNLVLQPLVENAIRHGLEPQARPGAIELRARREGPQLHLEVRDNGRGLSSSAPEEGVGLSNTRARLRELYGPHQQLEFSHPPDGGLTVRVVIPFRTGAG